MSNELACERLQDCDPISVSQKSLGPEAQKLFDDYGFRLSPYTMGSGLDVGYGGSAYLPWPGAVGLELGDKGYNGRDIPAPNGGYDFVMSSHCLEHIEYPVPHIIELWRVLKPGGFLIISVPHRDLYEKKRTLPSRFNPDHKRFYTPSYLLEHIETALLANTFRIRDLWDADKHFDYTIPPELHSGGNYSIVVVVQKLDLGQVTPPPL